MNRIEMIQMILNQYRAWEAEKQVLLLQEALKGMSDSNLIGLTQKLGLYKRPDAFASIFPNGARIAEVE